MSKKTREERMNKREVRTIDEKGVYCVDSELRATDDDGQPVIEGYAAVYDSESSMIGVEPWGFREIVKPGAFRKTLREANVAALWNHDPSMILGRSGSGTLTLSSTKKGLKYRVAVDPESRQAMDAWRAIKRGDVSQSSFAFRTIEDRWTERQGEPALRELLEVELFDVSPVTYPAYPSTSVDARSLMEAAGIDLENEERESGHEAEPVAPGDHATEEQAPTESGHAQSEPVEADHSLRRAKQRLAELSLKLKGRNAI